MIGNPKDPKRNGEGYADPTAYNALYNPTVETEAARKFLGQYYVLTKKIEMLSREKEELEEELGSINVNLDGMPRGTDISDRTGNLAAKLTDYYMKCIDLRSEAWDKRKEIESVIDTLDNVQHIELLKLRYIYRMKWEKIAVEIDLSWRHTHRMHHMALTEIGKKIRNKYE